MSGSDGTSGASSAPAPGAAPAAATEAVPAPTASQAAVVSGDFGTFREARRAERSGKPLPAPSPAATTLPPAGTPAAGTPASTEPPASEPGAATTTKPAGHGGNAETRIQELVRKNKDLERELADARGGKAAPSPQTARAGSSPAAPGAAPADPQPSPHDTAKYPEGQYDPKYITDLGAWGARQETRRLQAETDARSRAEAETASTRERYDGFSTRIDVAKTADPDFLAKLSPDVLALKPLSSLTTEEKSALAMKGDVASLAAAAVMEEVIESESSAQLLLHFSAHPEDLARLTALHPRQMLREFGRLEARLTPAAETAAADAPAPKTSSAPPPPAELKGKQHTPADPVQSALQRGDFAAYRAAKRARLETAAR